MQNSEFRILMDLSRLRTFTTVHTIGGFDRAAPTEGAPRRLVFACLFEGVPLAAAGIDQIGVAFV